jgi:hypothetical protein
MILPFVSCQNKKKMAVDDGIYIIPVTVQMTLDDGYFELNKNTKILTNRDNDEETWLLNYLSAYILKNTGLELNKGVSDIEEEINNTIVLRRSSEVIQDEGYRLTIMLFLMDWMGKTFFV